MAAAAPNGTRQIIWSNGEDTFCIAKIGLMLQLEEKCDAGIGQILIRLESGTWRLNDVRETIRLGLIGGGMDAIKAMNVVKLHVDDKPFGQSVLLAFAILEAALVGVPDDHVGKKKASAAPEEGGGLYREDGRLRRSSIYGLGAAIGFTPRELDELTLWELAACVDGYNRAHGGDDTPPEPLSTAEHEDMVFRHHQIMSDALH